MRDQSTWVRTFLGDLCEFKAGSAFPKAFQGNENGEIPFIKVSDLKTPGNGLRIQESANWIDFETLPKLKAKPLPEGTIVFAKIGEGLKAERFRSLVRETCIDNNLMGAIPKSVETRFLYYLLSFTGVAHLVEGSALPYLRQRDLEAISVCVPPLPEQRAIAATLGALDDKIESNRRQRNLCRQLGQALVARLEETVTKCSPLKNFALSISRGVTPRYYKDEDVEPTMVLNQRCIRDGWVSPNAARLMLPRVKAKSAGIAELGDLLVNSTGQGTLGRVGRWSYEDPLYVDSHVTVVKPDRTQIAPTLLSYLVFPRQPEIEDMAEGSTGQTELSPKRLGSLNLPVIPQVEQELIEPKLLVLEEKAHFTAVETAKLEALRDTLLPELMSGRIGVPEAREAIDQEVGL